MRLSLLYRSPFQFKLDASYTTSQLCCLAENMDFFDSISRPFHLWQFICLSPYDLKSQKIRSHPSSFYRNSIITAIVIQLLTVILCVIFFDKIVPPGLKQTIKVLDALTMVLAQLTALVIFLESFRKRRIQRNFFHKINSIDFIMEFKIGARPNYVEKKKIMARRMIGWLILIAVNFLTNFIVLSIAFDIAYRWWAIFFASYFICSLRYHQITTCVDVIHCRYQLLNDFINHLTADSNNQDDGGGNSVNTRRLTMFNVAEMRTDSVLGEPNQNKSDSIYEKLHHLRRVCRLLSSANRNINEAFKYSIPLIIVNDFLQILINWYWILRILLRPDIRVFHLIPPLFWSMLNFNHVVSLSAACHYATDEASFLRFSIRIRFRT